MGESYNLPVNLVLIFKALYWEREPFWIPLIVLEQRPLLPDSKGGSVGAVLHEKSRIDQSANPEPQTPKKPLNPQTSKPSNPQPSNPKPSTLKP